MNQVCRNAEDFIFETFRAIRRADFEACAPGILNEIRFVRGLFDEGKVAA